MLLDDILPEYDFTEIHSLRIKASPEIVFQSIKEITPAQISIMMRGLFYLRNIPERIAGHNELAFTREESLLSQMTRSHFVILDEISPQELVFGLIVPGNIGRVWEKTSSYDINLANTGEFFTFNHPDYIRVVANFLVTALPENDCVIVRTESRCKALSSQARNNFTPYWRIIRPFSGWIRRMWLKGIKRLSEK